MPFKVELTFDALSDLYELIQTLSKPDRRIGTVITSLSNVSERIMTMNAELQARLDTLTQRVAAVDGAEQSVLALVTELRAQMTAVRDELASSGVDAAQLASLDAMNEKLGAEVQQIAAAVAAPAQPVPAPVKPAPAPVAPTPVPAPVDPAPVDPVAPSEGEPPVVPAPDETVTVPPAPPNGPTP